MSPSVLVGSPVRLSKQAFLMARTRQGRENHISFSATAPMGEGKENWVFLQVVKTGPWGCALVLVASYLQSLRRRPFLWDPMEFETGWHMDVLPGCFCGNSKPFNITSENYCTIISEVSNQYTFRKSYDRQSHLRSDKGRGIKILQVDLILWPASWNRGQFKRQLHLHVQIKVVYLCTGTIVKQKGEFF